jgi:hypothetical protein
MISSHGLRTKFLASSAVDSTNVLHQAESQRWTPRCLDMTAEPEVHQSPSSVRRDSVHDEYESKNDHPNRHWERKGFDGWIVRDAENNHDDQHHRERDIEDDIAAIETPSPAAEQWSIFVGLEDQPPTSDATFIASDEAEKTGYDGEVDTWNAVSISIVGK